MKRLRTKRVREPVARGDGRRILVDRLWPRGVSKQTAAVHFWSKGTAPSDALRKWYRHDPAKWDEFRRRYFAELDAAPEAVAELRAEIEGARGAVTLVFDSKEEKKNNASALREYLGA